MPNIMANYAGRIIETLEHGEESEAARVRAELAELLAAGPLDIDGTAYTLELAEALVILATGALEAEDEPTHALPSDVLGELLGAEAPIVAALVGAGLLRLVATDHGLQPWLTEAGDGALMIFDCDVRP